MIYVGANVYYWGNLEQRRFILRALQPCALEARARNLACHFWYCRFDARGPHIFAVFAVNEEKRDSLKDFLDAQIRTFLLHSPSQADVSIEERQQRHKACRGKTLCSVDGHQGLADNNSFEFFYQQADDYPFWLSIGMSAAGQFWLGLDALVFWSFQYLEKGGLQAGIRWLATVDDFLKRSGFPAERYWRFHASTLLPGLQENIRGKTIQQVRTLIQNALTEKHHNTFSNLWNNQPIQDFDFNALMQCAMVPDGRTLDCRFQVLREINHTLLGQLGHRVSIHIPMILYAWHLNLQSLCDSETEADQMM